MKSPLLLPLLFTALASASAQDHIANGSFTGQTAGTAPQKPWIVPSQVTEASDVAVTVETLPGATDGKLWLKLADANPSVPTGVLQNFSEIKNGRLSLKVYFERVGSAFGVYLGAPKVSSPESRIIDFKVLKGGRLSLGNAGARTVSDFAFTAGKVYPLAFDFQTNADGTKISYNVTQEDTGESLGSAEVDARAPIGGLRIATDSGDDQTIVYVSDIALTEKN